MRLGFEKHPVTNLKQALTGFERSGFGVLWSPDRESALLSAPGGTRAAVHLEVHDVELELGAGGVYLLEDVDAFFRAHAERDWVVEPCDTVLGRYAALRTKASLPQRFLRPGPELAGHL
ncbi:hypothetical protein [Kineococcus rhizosphaerae]|uniref:VOC domain-containing protein n=1 Tax=Kineococcus rhizosphaerae TaxID=559628 RepID=A0A2T0R355_9ACTN|nr:hypothetical protein [Kineococcus rhizosphaerae]PRY14183.1 hypothetical protein CLV37_107303 [Kineococcus rhizosphaerae]